MFKCLTFILTLMTWFYSTSAIGIFNGAPVFHPRIVTVGEFGKDAYCKGILFEQDIVITAKHCVRLIPQEVYIHSLEKSFRVRDIKMMGALLDPNLGTDLALILIDKVDDKNIQSHPLKLSNFKLPEEMSVLSFGGTHSKNEFDATQISAGLFKVVNTNPFLEAKQSAILEPQFDDDQAGLHLCKGDSGGPNIVTVNNEDYLVGINSYIVKYFWAVVGTRALGIKKNEECLKTRGRILSISHYYRWINSTIELMRRENQNR